MVPSSDALVVAAEISGGSEPWLLLGTVWVLQGLEEMAK